MDESRVIFDLEQHVAVVRLNRPAKHNALDGEMFVALRAAVARVHREPTVRAVLLLGEGPSFCSGLDLASAADGAVDRDVLLGRHRGEVTNLAQSICYGWQQVPVPVIAAIHGACFGGGLQIALGADLRIAAPDARLSVMEIKLGLIPDMGITQALPRLVRADVAKELTFTGRTISGEEAAACGLVTRVADDPRGAARELAREIAARSPEAVRAAKRLFNEGWLSSPASGLALETELVRSLFGTDNQREAVQAAIAKRVPMFGDARIDPSQQ